MKKATASIPHCVWRDGRPRFMPGPGVRRLGYKGQDLKHPNGDWYDFEEARAFSEGVQHEVAKLRAKDPVAFRRAQPKRRDAPVTVGELVERWLASPRLSGRKVTVGKRTEKPLMPATVAHYRQMTGIVMTDHPIIWASPALAVSDVAGYRLYERIYEKRGLATARAVMIALGAAWKYGGKTGAVPKSRNPFHKLDMDTPEPRVRVGTIAEMEHLIAAADAIGAPEIGDSIMMGLATAQRKVDRLRLEFGGITDGELVFRQSKRGALVIVPAIPQLQARLDATRERRADWKVQYTQVIVNEPKRQPFSEAHKWDAYNKRYTAVRRAAVQGIKAENGRWLIEPMPSLADFRDQDLRDTAVTWLANAGCRVTEISSVTGHSETTVHTMLRHYLGQDPDRARSAIGKLCAWLDDKGARLESGTSGEQTD